MTLCRRQHITLKSMSTTSHSTAALPYNTTTILSIKHRDTCAYGTCMERARQKQHRQANIATPSMVLQHHHDSPSTHVGWRSNNKTIEMQRYIIFYIYSLSFQGFSSRNQGELDGGVGEQEGNTPSFLLIFLFFKVLVFFSHRNLILDDAQPNLNVSCRGQFSSLGVGNSM